MYIHKRLLFKNQPLLYENSMLLKAAKLKGIATSELNFCIVCLSDEMGRVGVDWDEGRESGELICLSQGQESAYLKVKNDGTK